MSNNEWNGKIWEGVYNSFEEAPGEKGVFNMSFWLDKQKNQLDKKLDLVNTEKKVEISSLAESREYYLPIIIGIESCKKSIKVLDLGGGLASSYLETLSALPNQENVEFLIVENPSICKMGNEIFSEDSKIKFHVKLPLYDANIDIIHLGSSLQYMEEWEKILIDLSKYKAKYLIFADLPAADIDTFVTIQNYYGNRIPVRFWNLKEFITVVENLGYQLAFKARYIKDNPIKHGTHDIDSIKICFDNNYRLDYFSQLVFRLNE
jgi:putative methyltransferase (TIGR04325 family)